VRIIYDALIGTCDDPDELALARQLLVQGITLALHKGAISAQHHALALKMLPEPKRSRGRPQQGKGDAAYDKNWQLYYDWVYDKTREPSLTEEQFAKRRLGISETSYDHDPYDRDHKRVSNLLKDLQPSRLKERLGEGVMRSILVGATLTARAAEYRSSGATQD
jgi:hypothetical protein